MCDWRIASPRMLRMSVPWVPAVDELVSTAWMPPSVLVKRVTFGKVLVVLSVVSS